MTITIKPCPFCGGTDIKINEGTTFRWRYAICCDCGAQAGEVRVQTLGKGAREEWEKVAALRAMELWNKRTP